MSNDRLEGSSLPPRRPLRPRWHRLGYALTLAWLVAVLAVTRGDRTHALYEFIFTAPLAAWIVAVVIDRILRRRGGNARPHGR